MPTWTCPQPTWFAGNWVVEWLCPLLEVLALARAQDPCGRRPSAVWEMSHFCSTAQGSQDTSVHTTRMLHSRAQGTVSRVMDHKGFGLWGDQGLRAGSLDYDGSDSWWRSSHPSPVVMRVPGPTVSSLAPHVFVHHLPSLEKCLLVSVTYQQWVAWFPWWYCECVLHVLYDRLY